jgi:hypothetical protein
MFFEIVRVLRIHTGSSCGDQVIGRGWDLFSSLYDRNVKSEITAGSVATPQ